MKYSRKKVLNDIVNEIYNITDKKIIIQVINKHLDINKIMTSLDELEKWVIDVFKMKKKLQEELNTQQLDVPQNQIVENE